MATIQELKEFQAECKVLSKKELVEKFNNFSVLDRQRFLRIISGAERAIFQQKNVFLNQTKKLIPYIQNMEQ